jgi:hypothetical protein
MAKVKHEFELVDLTKIYLDNDNPRHTAIANEPDIIAHLLKKEQVKPLARSIAELGSTSPLERLALMPHPRVRGGYVSLEGNRRVCALKLLSDPEKAPGEPEKRYFRGLAKKLGTGLTKAEAAIFSSRKDARPWLSLRHEGAMGGVGTRTWNARQKERFDRAGGVGARLRNPNTQASLLLDYGLDRGLITRDEHDAISLTTLTRFLKSPVFRHTIGLATGRDISVVVPQEQFDVAAQRFLKDAYKGGDVNSRTNRKNWEAYAHQLRERGIAPTTRLMSPEQPDAKSPKNRAAAGGERADRAIRDPDLRRRVIPSDFSAPVKERVLRRIYGELRGLDSKEFSFAAAYLLRAFIERTATLFGKQFGLGHEGELHIVLGRCEKKLRAEGLRENELKPLRVMASEKDSRISPHTLGARLHGGLIPTSAELARFWDTIEGNMKAMLVRLK